MLQTKRRLSLEMSVNAQQMRAREKQVKQNREVLCRLLDATLFLGKQNLAFCAHRAPSFPEFSYTCGGKAVNEGNFLELVRLLAKYNGILAHHLVTAPKNANYLSPQIQSQFIDVNDALAGTVKARIVSEVKSACYFTSR